MVKANKAVYTITYCSRNRVDGDPARVRQELENILTASRRNNEALEVTGALLYNAGNFAQILEGPLTGVEAIFEKVQRELRHSEVTVIHSGFSAERQFPDWAMAFAGGSSIEGTEIVTASFEAVFSGASSGGEQMLALLRNLMVDESDWLLMDTAVMSEQRN